MDQQAYTVAKISDLLKADYRGDPDCVISSLAPLESAGPGQASFLDNSKYRKFLKGTQASLVVLSPKDLEQCPTNAIVDANPYLAYAKLTELFKVVPKTLAGIHPTAVIGKNCHIDPSVSIDAYAVIGDNVTIAKDANIGAGCVIGENCKIGAASCLWPNVTLYHQIEIGDRVQIHSGVVIGADGFGFAKSSNGWYKVSQLGAVCIGDDVEIGANTTIDRGALGNTIIETGVKLDNQIQVGHNVRIGAHTIIAGCVGIAGSTVIGKNCVIGGGACLVGHISIADGTIIAGMAGVSKTITEPNIYSSGLPADRHELWKKNVIQFRRLHELAERVSDLEKILADSKIDK